MFFHEAAARALADQGVDTVFGVIGDANLFMMESFRSAVSGTYIAAANEAGAVIAACGYARRGRRLGVASVTQGPALTNTVTALVDGVRAKTPMLLVAGDTTAEERHHNQAIGQREIVLATGAGFEQVRAPHTLAEDLARAVSRAGLESRPVVLNVPRNFQWEAVDYRPVKRTFRGDQAVRPDAGALDVAVGMIASAKRPVVLAGRGAANPEARKSLLRLAERIGAPVATTVLAMDLFRGTRHNLGICGTVSHEVALETILASDCIVAFGAGLNWRTTAEGSLLEGKRVIQVDVDPSAFEQWYGVTTAVLGDAKEVADAIVDWLDEAQVQQTGYASDALAGRLAGLDVADFADQSTDATLDIRTALLRIEAAFPKDRTLVFDAGRFIHSLYTFLHVQDPQSYVHTINFGSIGLGMGNAIGAGVAAPEEPVLLITGDGGFMLGGLAEFNTAVRHHVDVVVVVFNDGAYGAEYVQLTDRDMDPSISVLDWPDLAPVATALGGLGLTVRTLPELEAALTAVAHRDRPMLIDVRVDPERMPHPPH